MDYRIFIKKGFTLKFEETIAEGTTSQIDIFGIHGSTGERVNELCVPHQARPYATAKTALVIIEPIVGPASTHEEYELLPGGFRHEALSQYKTR